MRVAILCNGKDLARWQRQAVDKIAAEHELFLLACSEPPPPKRRLRHAAYYALNLASIRNRMTRRVPFPETGSAITDRFDVRPIADGAWATLPTEAIAWLKDRDIDAVVKFGLGLLKVPPPDSLPVPILSFHHGDPSAYRGRPAGYYELANNEPFVGQVVQVLSNKLDAGRVVAFAQSRAFRHSYRRTLIEAYALSPHLLAKALEAVAKDESLAVLTSGRNYRLPGNWAVALFLWRRMTALCKWLAYGAFVEKRWQVASCDIADGPTPLTTIASAESRPWSIPRILPPFRFHADPFFEGDAGRFLVEALNGWTGKGEILRIEGESTHRLRGGAGHLSYPVTLDENGQTYVLPESSEWSPAGIFRLEYDRLVRVGDLDVGSRGLIDPTPFRHDGRLYLFANRVEDGPSVLHLWSAPSLFGRFELHPSSPVRISARGSRMAGEVALWGGQLYRLGQDCRNGYGDGILAFRIDTLSATHYGEAMIGQASFGQRRGPHTLNKRDGKLLFDFYSERFSPLAGLRRLAGRTGL